MTVGSTDFSTGNGELQIYLGVNDKRGFYAGATKSFDITIPTTATPNSEYLPSSVFLKDSYLRDELIEIINHQM